MTTYGLETITLTTRGAKITAESHKEQRNGHKHEEPHSKRWNKYKIRRNRCNYSYIRTQVELGTKRWQTGPEQVATSWLRYHEQVNEELEDHKKDGSMILNMSQRRTDTTKPRIEKHGNNYGRFTSSSGLQVAERKRELLLLHNVKEEQ